MEKQSVTLEIIVSKKWINKGLKQSPIFASAVSVSFKLELKIHLFILYNLLGVLGI